MADDLDAICTDLDTLMRKFFVEWSRYRYFMETLSKNVKNGYLNISKTRYSIGVGSISELQIPDHEFRPLVEVTCNEHMSAEKHEKDIIELIFFHTGKKPQNMNVEISNQGDAATNTVRKRFIQTTEIVNTDDAGSKKQESESIMEESDKISHCTNETELRPDPLKWFGYLAPTCLRQGQVSFQEATNNVVQAVNAKIRLHRIILDFEELKKKKQKLLSDVETVSCRSDTQGN
ncbi:coiled-coil domain-containing protein 115-like [Rhopilema esculentum]|uniref:coiled-coil domain-containing protein 115-like n=1 Tax=Rhopilema esculentum TaxID=499914 RepID=UPI0031D3C23E|eukprot:gene6290-11711_t